MFRRRYSYSRRWGLTGIVRLFLSLVIMAILGLGLIQAYRAFSGFDPLTSSPETLIKSVFESDSVIEAVTKLLSFEPTQFSDQAKKLLNENGAKDQQTTFAPTAPLLYRFAVVADSHLDVGSLNKALNLAKATQVKFVIGMGDFSDVGTIEELRATKKEFDLVGLSYYVIPGDHDLWDSRNRGLSATTNFTQVFGVPYQSLAYQNTRIILVNNSDNYGGLDQAQLDWLEQELDRVSQEPSKLLLVFISIPLYHPSSDHVMGKTEAKLTGQAQHLMTTFARKGVDEVIAGDAHFFSRYVEPTNNLKMTTAGAVTATKNAQAPRLLLVDVYEDGSYNLQDIEIK